MALALYFRHPTSFTTATYDQAIARLKESGLDFGKTPGRLFHCAMTDQSGQVSVFDVWEDEASFRTFGETLIPILRDLGSDPGDPQVMQVHNWQQG